MFFWRLKIFIKTVRAVLFALVVLLVAWLLGVVKLDKLTGSRTFYLQSASSQSLLKKELSLGDVGRVKGESVLLTLEEGESAETIIALYDAEVLFTERAGDVLSYYCYTDAWTEGVQIGESFVNLHVAVSGTRCAVGVPIIFGGF